MPAGFEPERQGLLDPCLILHHGEEYLNRERPARPESAAPHITFITWRGCHRKKADEFHPAYPAQTLGIAGLTNPPKKSKVAGALVSSEPDSRLGVPSLEND